MRDAGTAIRTSFINALAAQLTSDSLTVPVVDGKVEALGTREDWVVLNDQTEVDHSNKHQWACEITMQIDVYTRKKSVAGKKVVEGITNQILGIVLPSINVIGLSIASPFQIIYVTYDNSKAQTVRQTSAKDFENIKMLEFKIFITQ